MKSCYSLYQSARLICRPCLVISFENLLVPLFAFRLIIVFLNHKYVVDNLVYYTGLPRGYTPYGSLVRKAGHL